MEYIGNELALFERAHNWKRYVASIIRPFIGKSVLEVGAGMGGTTQILCDERCSAWTCLEPDRKLAGDIRTAIEKGRLPGSCTVQAGTLRDVDDDRLFDAILYIDVLEHIFDDRGELEHAADHLAKNGTLIVLAPAHPWLFSPFDESIGHYRRYTDASLTKIVPPYLRTEKLMYLDSVGLFLSLSNRLFLKQNSPSARQIRFWDRVIIPASRIVDRPLLYRFGKSIIGIWRNTR